MGTGGPQPREESNFSQRRERRRVKLDGFITRAGGINRAIEVIDMNYGGCGIRTPAELAIGEAVQISVLGRGAISAQVRWYQDGKAGLEFEPVPDETKKQIERGAGRRPVPGEVGLRVAGKATYQVRVFDLSTDGCKVELVVRPSIGDPMLVKFEGLEVIGATVAWVHGHTGGLKFERPIHPAVLDLLVARLRRG
jgi:hypothetical protein